MKAALALVAAVCAGIAVIVVIGFLAVTGAGAACASSPGVPLPGSAAVRTAHGDWSRAQLENAAAIIAEGQRLRIPPRGWTIAVATAMQESGLLVLANPNVPASLALPHQGTGDDHDSVGLFQQRPSWGTTAQLMDPATSAAKFYARMLQVPGWASMALTDVAQAVQISAYPDAYGRWEPDAVSLVVALTGGQGTEPAGLCGDTGWTQPVLARITSEYRTAERPDHNGVDLGAALGTPVHAAAAGVVLVAECDPATIDCDRPGSSATPGCGWYVDIGHPGEVITRYCHLRTRPTVRAGEHVLEGQVIGEVGDSGNADGPHLHFEVHLGGDSGPAGTVDPVRWMDQHGAPLG